MRVSTILKLWDKVSLTSSDCWEWTAHRDKCGYGRMCTEGKLQSAHRLAYEAAVGPIPKGLELDHLCRNRGCINPEHLEPVTHRENMLRGLAGAWQRATTHCPHGHEYNAENTLIAPRPNGAHQRICKACNQKAMKAWRAKNPHYQAAWRAKKRLSS